MLPASRLDTLTSDSVARYVESSRKSGADAVILEAEPNTNQELLRQVHQATQAQGLKVLLAVSVLPLEERQVASALTEVRFGDSFTTVAASEFQCGPADAYLTDIDPNPSTSEDIQWAKNAFASGRKTVVLMNEDNVTTTLSAPTLPPLADFRGATRALFLEDELPPASLPASGASVSLATTISLSNQPATLSNAAGKALMKRQQSMLKEFLAMAQWDGVILKDLQYQNILSESAPLSLQAFAQDTATSLTLSWPQDVLQLSNQTAATYPLKPGPRFEKWMQWKADQLTSISQQFSTIIRDAGSTHTGYLGPAWTACENGAPFSWKQHLGWGNLHDARAPWLIEVPMLFPYWSEAWQKSIKPADTWLMEQSRLRKLQFLAPLVQWEGSPAPEAVEEAAAASLQATGAVVIVTPPDPQQEAEAWPFIHRAFNTEAKLPEG